MDYIRCFSAPDNLRDWLRMRAQTYGAEISPRAAAAISDLLSYDEHSRNARGKKRGTPPQRNAGALASAAGRR